MKGTSIVLTYGGKLVLGEDILINQRVIIYSNSRIKIGNHCRVGWCVQIYDTPVHYMIDLKSGNIKNPCKPIEISDNVWIANHATITAGAKIPPFTTVASHALVNKDFSKDAKGGCVLFGIPAKMKMAGKVRLLNDRMESEIKNIFVNNSMTQINIKEMNEDAYPLCSKNNIIYRSN